MTALSGLPPILHADTRLVILGSFPGAASLAAQQYYGHPRNQFWRLLGATWGEELAVATYPQRLQALRAHRVGLWDTYAACERQGSLDSAIRAAQPNDLQRLRREAPGLRAVAHNGAESARSRGLLEALGLEVHVLPSSSPAHAARSFDDKLAAWRAVLERYDPA